MDIVIATLIGTITYLGLGWFDFEFLLGKYMKSTTLQLKGFNKSDEDFNFPALVISCAAYSALLVMILSNWNQSELSFIDATLISAVVGALIAVMANAYWFASTHFFNSVKPLLVDCFAAGITVGLTGGIISLFI